MSQGRYVNGELVNTVYVVNMASGGGGGGGITSGEVSGIVSGIIASGLDDVTISGQLTVNGCVNSNLIPCSSGAFDLGSLSFLD